MTTTSTVAIVSGSYTQVASGSANVLIQGLGKSPFEYWVGASAPSPNSPLTAGQVVAENEGFSASLTGLTGTDLVFVRSCNPAGGTVAVVKS